MLTPCSDFLSRQKDLRLAVVVDFEIGFAQAIRKNQHPAEAELLGHCWNQIVLLPAAVGSFVTRKDLHLDADLTVHQKGLHLVAVGC